jgi:hypothetical protein
MIIEEEKTIRIVDINFFFMSMTITVEKEIVVFTYIIFNWFKTHV